MPLLLTLQERDEAAFLLEFKKNKPKQKCHL